MDASRSDNIPPRFHRFQRHAYTDFQGQILADRHRLGQVIRVPVNVAGPEIAGVNLSDS